MYYKKGNIDLILFVIPSRRIWWSLFCRW